MMTEKEFTHTILPLAKNVYSFALNMIGNPDDSADITQDVMLKLWISRDDLRHVSSPKAWALKITRNLCLDWLKKQKPTYDEQEAIRNGGCDRDMIAQLEAQETAEMVRNVIDTLPDNQREVMILREIEELEFDEIAQITGLTTNNIRVLLSRGRAEVRQKLKGKRREKEKRK